jgi:shikimate dehydrogenase
LGFIPPSPQARNRSPQHQRYAVPSKTRELDPMHTAPEITLETTPQVARFALFGSPVAQSRSPWIHARFAEQTKIAMSYSAVDAAPDAFAATLAAFEAGGGAGANITLPHKAAAAALCRQLSDTARRTGVANTLSRLPEGGWRGDNTDGLGLIADIAERHRLDLRGRRTLVLGAGGAVQGVVHALLDAGIDSLVLANRSADKADALADRLGQPDRVHTVYWNDLHDAGMFEFVLNGTAAGQRGAKLDLPFSLTGPRTLVYDMNYGAASVDFTAWGRASGCSHVYDGIGMLVEQAAEAFAIWHGVRPDTVPVYEALRALVDRG